MPYAILCPVNLSAPGIIQKKQGIEKAKPKRAPVLKLCLGEL